MPGLMCHHVPGCTGELGRRRWPSRCFMQDGGMSRGLLREAVLAAIQMVYTDVGRCSFQRVVALPGFLAANFEPHDYTPVAAVCFHDCTGMLAQTRYALVEHFAHGEYFVRAALHRMRAPRRFLSATTWTMRPCACMRPVNIWRTAS